MATEVTPAYLRERLNYDPETGIFTWRTNKRTWLDMVGKPAGYFHPKLGYMRLRLHYKTYQYHRLVWAWMTGEWPEHVIDHKNRDKRDNRWENLRSATSSQNMANSKMLSNNTTGYRGVQDLKNGRWGARISVNRKIKWLGTFATAEEASAAYKEWAPKLHGEFASPETVKETLK